MKKVIILALGVWILASCASPKKDRESVHQKWIESLPDSISQLQNEVKQIEDSIKILHEEIAENLKKFDYVENPREVEGYSILSSHRNHYPLQATGLIARISKSEQFELIAVLSGGNFNQISLSCGDISVKSSIVPHDQALNYRAGGINTVAFSGEQADSLGNFILENRDREIMIHFLPGNAKTKLSDSSKQMIAETWELCSEQKEVGRMERSLTLIYKKIDAYRRLIENRKN